MTIAKSTVGVTSTSTPGLFGSPFDVPEDGPKAVYIPFNESMLFNLIRHRFAQDRDIKISIESHGWTGLGKTTLARLLCEAIDPYWDVETQAVVDADEYLRIYDELPPRSCILFDEFEREADSRRSMTHKNVETFQKLQIARYRNIATVWTLPYLAAIDKRAPQLADINIQLKQKGTGEIFWLSKKSFIRNGQAGLSIYPIPLYWGNGRREVVQWRKQDDEVTAHLESLKMTADEGRGSGVQRLTQDELDDIIRKAKKNERRVMLRDVVGMYLDNDERIRIETQKSIAEMFDVSPQWITEVKQDIQKETAASA